MAVYSLTSHFQRFFRNLNPSESFEKIASREYESIKSLIEDKDGFASELSPTCFLQGSYKQDTAIYTINDVDVVALCELWHPSSGAGRSWKRHEIFDTIAAPLLNSNRYKDKVHYQRHSMCIKVDLGIKVEILPVVYLAGNHNPQFEPFRLYRPGNNEWEDGYARYHQNHLSKKNVIERTGGNFIPAIKVFKHLRSQFVLDTISFHIECLLFSLPDYLFKGNLAEYIEKLLSHLASISASDWYSKVIKTPCGERDIFVSSEWKKENWEKFHKVISTCSRGAKIANQSRDRMEAIEAWQLILGEDFFPKFI